MSSLVASGDSRIEVYDIETIVNFYSYYSLDINTGKEYCFIIHESKNELQAFINHLNSVKAHIGFNNLGFDAQVIQYILESCDCWLDMSGEEVATLIYKYSQYVIEKSNSKQFLDYPEWKLGIPQLDLFKIWHFDNKSKMTSLKWVQYMIDYHNIEEMPISHDTKVTEDMIDSIISYNRNDVLSTYEFYKITKGDTNHILYKGIDKLQLRKDIAKEFGINCRNYNDVKIGDEINKVNYIRSLGIKKNDISKPITKNIKLGVFGDYYPKYTKFKTQEFNNFINSISSIELIDKKQEFKFTFNDTTYTIAKGGIHSEDKPRLIVPNENEILLDADIGSQYPNAIRKRRLYPRHLGPTWLKGYTDTIEKRIVAKKAYKESRDSKLQAIQEAGKLQLNGGGYGKLGEQYNWQYDPISMYMCTIGNQIEILMLIESLELANIHVISANTDGLVCLFDRNKIDEYYNICKSWEVLVGNSELGQLEYTEYRLLAQSSVNDYIAIKTSGEIKCKGDFLSDFELHKNKSARIVPLALQAYFKDEIKPGHFIPKCTNIFDFCLGVKSQKGAKFISYDPKTGNEIKLQKVNRYYISNNGTHLLKRLKPLEDKKPTKQLDIFGLVNDGTRQSEVEAGWLSTIYNKHIIKEKFEDYNIDYSFYIEKANKIINNILKNA